MKAGSKDVSQPAVIKNILTAGVMLLLLATAASPLFAQCSMCYQNAAAQGSQGIRALNLGILILLVPPLAIGACITRAAYRSRDSGGQPGD